MAQRQIKDTPTIKHPVTWFLVADARKARVYARQREERFVPIIGNAPAHQVESNIVHSLSPLSGMQWDAETPDTSTRTGSHFETHPDYREELRQQFARLVASHLNQTPPGQGLYDRLAIIAPAKMIADLKKNLSENVKKHITEEISKDLTRCNEKELEGYLEHIF